MKVIRDENNWWLTSEDFRWQQQELSAFSDPSRAQSMTNDWWAVTFFPLKKDIFCLDAGWLCVELSKMHFAETRNLSRSITSWAKDCLKLSSWNLQIHCLMMCCNDVSLFFFPPHIAMEQFQASLYQSVSVSLNVIRNSITKLLSIPCGAQWTFSALLSDDRHYFTRRFRESGWCWEEVMLHHCWYSGKSSSEYIHSLANDYWTEW